MSEEEYDLDMRLQDLQPGDMLASKAGQPRTVLLVVSRDTPVGRAEGIALNSDGTTVEFDMDEEYIGDGWEAYRGGRRIL